MELNKIIEDAIPLDMNCEIKRKDQLRRREQLKKDIEVLVRDKTQPYKPKLEYKDGESTCVK